MKKILTLFCAGYLLLASSTVFSQVIPKDTLQFLIQKNTEALGGKKNLEAVKTIVRIRGNASMVTVQQLRPYAGLAVIAIDTVKWNVRYAEGANDKYYWEQEGADSSRKIVKGRPDTAIWQTRQSPSNLFLPLYKLRAKGHKVEYKGRESVDNINYYILAITLSNGFSSTWYMNPVTYMLERNTNFRRHHAYQENIRHIETIWKDFRKVNNVFVPFIEQERDMDTGEILSGGKPSVSIIFNLPINDADMALNGDSNKWVKYLKDFLQARGGNKNM
jgi:hypothetical protein